MQTYKTLSVNPGACSKPPLLQGADWITKQAKRQCKSSKRATESLIHRFIRKFMD
jgi:hypothetical protein